MRVTALFERENSLFVFGLGYSGLAAANYFKQKGWSVSGTCRGEDKTDALNARGFEAYQYDTDGIQQLGRPALAALQRATHILSTVPPDGGSDPVLMAHSSHIAARAKQLDWIGYISSTGVYGDHEGEWVDEGSELLAAHGKGLSRMLAESEWLALCYEFEAPIHLFRCGGIYGPRRSALESVRAAELGGSRAVSSLTLTQERRRRQRFTSRIHVLDLCSVLDASAASPRPGAIYNVVDDDPAGRAEVEDYAQRLLRQGEASGWGRSGGGGGGGGSREPAISGSESENNGKSGQAGSAAAATEATARGEKRVRNELIKRELEVELEFPSYREGIAALYRGDIRPFDDDLE